MADDKEPLRPTDDADVSAAAGRTADDSADGAELPPLHEVSADYRRFLSESMDRHEERALEARRKIETGEYGFADWQRDLFSFGAQVWSDAVKATSHAADLTRARVDPTQS